MARLNLSPPWIVLYNKMKAFFKQDNEVHVGYDDNEKKIVVYVDNAKKAEALSWWLVDEIEFGNIKVKITVVPSNKVSEETFDSVTINDAFKGNTALNGIRNVSAYGFDMTFVIFNAVVVQYNTDDISDYYGMQSTLYEDIARDIASPLTGVYYCTEQMVGGPLGKPLGEWP